MKSTNEYLQKINKLREKIENADAIVIGAGAGLSTASGLTYSGERFQKNFASFIDKYHFGDMYSATFYPYESLEEYWAYMSRHIYLNRYAAPVGKPLRMLMGLIEGKNYFVLTTNVDHQFQRAGIDKQRLFYTQGDYELWQCKEPCHNETYSNEMSIRKMVKEQERLRIPKELIPYCSKCGQPMVMNLRCDDKFVQDSGWHRAHAGYEQFLRSNQDQKVLYLELGVGSNTPIIIKYPFWQMTSRNLNSTYASINIEEATCPREIENRSICIEADISQVMDDLASK